MRRTSRSRASTFRALLAVTTLTVAGSPPAAWAGLGDECGGPGPIPVGEVAVGEVDCWLIDSVHVGGPTPVSYYVPPGCDPALGRECPWLFFAHGTGGDYQSALGEKGSNGATLVAALTSGPPDEYETSVEPWTFQRDTWVPREPIDMVLVTAHCRTVPGGHGPASDADCSWMDWHPRYAEGGDEQAYGTPPPRFEAYMMEEILPFVDDNLPVGKGREYRAANGNSGGAVGAFRLALAHPDEWGSVGLLSGTHIPYPSYLLDGLEPDLPAGLSPPVPVPYLGPLPPLSHPVTGAVFTSGYLNNPNAGYFLTVGMGDLVSDSAYVRGQNPGADMVPNARAWSADGTQSLDIRLSAFDGVPRRVEDLEPRKITVGADKTVLNRELELMFERHGIERDYRQHPGINLGHYQTPLFRGIVEQHYANLRHHDGSGDPGPWAAVFDYRTIRTSFDVWGWRFTVDRGNPGPTELLYLTNVSCQSLTLRGSGAVTVTVPDECGSGLDGATTFAVDLGPPQPVDEPIVGASRAYGKTVTVVLEDLP